MMFFRWMCVEYVVKRRRRWKRKSVNQYWRDFKMLYSRVNGISVDTNTSAEVVKVSLAYHRFDMHDDSSWS